MTFEIQICFHMPKLTKNIPDDILVHCKRLQEINSIGGVSGEDLSLCFDASAMAGIDQRVLKTLLIGLAGCEDWLDSDLRKLWQDGAQSMREWTRPVKNSKYGSQAFDHRRDVAYTFSERGIRQIQSALMYGFSVKCGSQIMSAPTWRPIAPVLYKLVSSLNEDDNEAIINAVRQRLNRWRKKHGAQVAEELSLRYFSTLYATLYPKD